ncbi:MAG TPA: hypothetical protein VE977_02645, partial [Pyrinomonadaceae bacterium]|nr:hypothetical protein [Pyrinomonadaceae bacterium]
RNSSLVQDSGLTGMDRFHIHVDAVTLSAEFEEYLVRDLGFWRSDFSGHPEGVEHFEPPHHFTVKVASSAEFRARFGRMVSYAETNSPMKGYLEGEFIALDEEVKEQPFNPLVKTPFRIQKTNLPSGGFRESEIHVVLNRDKSEPLLLQSLVEMGLYTAYMNKPYGTAQIFTVQGSREKIQLLLPALKEYLENAGGAVNCSIKEERVADWWLSEPTLQLPPVVGSIEWQ